MAKRYEGGARGMTRGTDTIHYHVTILHILKRIDFFKMRGARGMKYKFSPRADEVFKKLIIKDLRGKGFTAERIGEDVINIEWEEKNDYHEVGIV